jgi:hypothetical protein
MDCAAFMGMCTAWLSLECTFDSHRGFTSIPALHNKAIGFDLGKPSNALFQIVYAVKLFSCILTTVS